MPTPPSDGGSEVGSSCNTRDNRADPDMDHLIGVLQVDRLTLQYEVAVSSRRKRNLVHGPFDLPSAKTGEWAHQIDMEGAHIRTWTKAGRQHLRLDISPSQFIEKPTLYDMGVVVAHLWAETADHFPPLDEDFCEARVTRLDIARDFEIDSPGEVFVLGLLPQPRAWAKMLAVYFDPVLNNAQTLMVGSKSGGVVRLYDRFAASGKEEDRGVLRWELQARTGWLKKCGSAFGDFTEKMLLAMVLERWRWSRMGTRVAGVNAFIEAVSATDLKPDVQDRLLGHSLRIHAGLPPAAPERTANKYRQRLEEIGLVLEPGCLSHDSHLVRRLDLATGLEVTTNAG